ncbi:cupin domain-containing protein [Gordonia sp. WA4-43]|jgi:quercetin dioxygenase-like cupin family protein|uniref:cupin domain-containing protein n=1 Tax=Gordonia sp. WA4-43 TaxID=2878678 RepID=UPI001CFA6932|nr:cupin domain-containing protein [Gordonia sp. WA4-43]UCZ88987.1 cupin domain-containing protein [Gordonia sp. WA4-43]
MSDWTLVDDLAVNTGSTGDRPDVAVLARTTGANVVRLSFHAGQSMPDHRTGRPILVIGQDGEVDVSIGDETTLITPGRAVHIEPDVGHALVARTDAVVTLVVLEKPAD